MSFVQFAMQFAATFAVQAACAWNDARRSHPTLTSTVHVALHDAAQVSAHDDCVFEWQPEAQLSLHCALQ
jgi:hypothetical protein